MYGLKYNYLSVNSSLLTFDAQIIDKIKLHADYMSTCRSTKQLLKFGDQNKIK